MSGTGKSTLGAALSKVLHLPFIDGDDLHPAANVAKMSRGEPLDDDDRQPWLATIRETAIMRVRDQLGVHHIQGEQERAELATKPNDGDEERGVGLIVACSSLKKAYRALLRGEGAPTSLQTEPQTRMQTQRPRSGPGTKLNMLSLPTYFVYLKGDKDVLVTRMQTRKGHFMKAGMLESQLNTLESPEDEPGVVTVSAEMSTEEQVRTVVEMFGSQGETQRTGPES